MASSPHPSTRFAAVIVAAGKGLRAGQPIPKQFALWRGKPVVRHSAETFHAAGASPIVVVIPQGADRMAADALNGLPVRFVVGGATRQASVRAALESLERDAPSRVLIHDAARPDLPPSVIDRLCEALDTRPGAIPVLRVIDSLAQAKNGLMASTAPREDLRRVQTPQAFRFPDILTAHQAWHGQVDAGDDAQVLAADGHCVALVDGDERLRKLTFAEDFVDSSSGDVRTGTGFDVHRLAEGEELWLGGLLIPHPKGLSGHSDADVALHAVVDALLGAAALGDIGQHFPPGDPRWKGARSDRFVEHAVSLLDRAGYRVGNLDLTIICEAPKIGPYRDAMRKKLAALLRVETGRVSVKATTTERLGFTGRGEGIAAQAIATVLRG